MKNLRIYLLFTFVFLIFIEPSKGQSQSEKEVEGDFIEESFQSESLYDFLRKSYPELDVGVVFAESFFQFVVLTDFKRGRVVLTCEADEFEFPEMHKNGEFFSKPYKNKELVSKTVLHEGNPYSREISCYWLNLKSTDRLNIQVEITSYIGGFKKARETLLEVSYCPDSRWQVNCRREEEDVSRADIYQISDNELVPQIRKVLAKKEICTIRDRFGGDLSFRTCPTNPEDSVNFYIEIGAEKLKVVEDSGLTAQGAQVLLDNYVNSLAISGHGSKMLIKCNEDSDDSLFRETLRVLKGVNLEVTYFQWLDNAEN